MVGHGTLIQGIEPRPRPWHNLICYLTLGHTLTLQHATTQPRPLNYARNMVGMSLKAGHLWSRVL
jgi:hypothetical protein